MSVAVALVAIVTVGSAAAAGVQGEALRLTAVAPTVAAEESVEPTPDPVPVVEYKELTETEPVPFAPVSVDDSSQDVGYVAVTTPAADGVLTRTCKVTVTDGVESKRVLESEVLTVSPVDEVTSYRST